MPGVLLTDALVTCAAAWLLACAGGHGGRGPLEAALALCLSFVALVAGAGIILGATGGFGPAGFLAVHSLALAALALARRRRISADLGALSNTWRQARQFLDSSGPEGKVALVLLAALAAFALLAAMAEPETLDALTYHLPRIGHWLQDGRVQVLASADARLNFVAVLPDIFMAWLVGGVRQGFRLAVLAQAFGGVATLGATIGLARQSGLNRRASLLAGGLLLGMANVAVQFTSAQTDLFTTGVLAASFYLWLAALRRGGCSDLGAMGAGLAIGAKGTLFYLAPGAVIWVAWLGWHHPLAWAKWRRTLAAAALGVCAFAFPGFARNWLAYGDALGPREWVQRLHQGLDSGYGQAHKVYWNLKSALAQTLEPQSQPLGLRSVSRDAGLAIARSLPTNDRYTLGDLDRRATLEKLLQRTDPDVDVTSFGVVTSVVFVGGALLALSRRREAEGRLILVWSAGIAVFILFFYAMQQWHPFGFRYFVLVAPWVAVVAAWGIEQLAPPWRNAAWILAAAAALDVGWHVTVRTHQAGWQSVVRPERYAGYFAEEGWRAWSGSLDRAGDPFRLALPEERPIAAFYRQWPRRQVEFKSPPEEGMATAEEFVRGARGWVIVPATRFLGREGRVAASVWLFGGDESSVYSLAAYRTLGAGEKPQTIFYRWRRTVAGGAVSYELLVKGEGGGAVRLALSNPSAGAFGFEWSSPLARAGGVLAAGARTVIALPVPAGVVSQVRVSFEPSPGQETGPPLPTLEPAP